MMVAHNVPRMKAEITVALDEWMDPDTFADFRRAVVWFPAEESADLSDSGRTITVCGHGPATVWADRISQVLEIQGVRAAVTGRMKLA